MTTSTPTCSAAASTAAWIGGPAWVPPSARREAGRVLPAAQPGMDDGVRARAVLAWSSLFGAVSFELFGHVEGALTDPDEFFDAAVRDLAGLVGLGAEG